MPKPKNVRKARNSRQRRKAGSWRTTQAHLDRRSGEEAEAHGDRVLFGQLLAAAEDDERGTAITP